MGGSGGGLPKLEALLPCRDPESELIRCRFEDGDYLEEVSGWNEPPM